MSRRWRAEQQTSSVSAKMVGKKKSMVWNPLRIGCPLGHKKGPCEGILSLEKRKKKTLHVHHHWAESFFLVTVIDFFTEFLKCGKDFLGTLYFKTHCILMHCDNCNIMLLYCNSNYYIAITTEKHWSKWKLKLLG